MMRKRLAVFLIATTILGGALSGCTAFDEMTDGEHPVRAPGQPGYTVSAEPGDTVESVATRFELPANAVIQTNHLRPPYTLRPHQILVIPPPATYRVHNGDTVAEIATLLGVDEVALARANGLQKPYQMRVNQVLRVPGGWGDGGLVRDAAPESDPNLAYVPPGQAAVTPRSSISTSSLAPPPGIASGTFGQPPSGPPMQAPPMNAVPPRGYPTPAPMNSPTALAPQQLPSRPSAPQAAYQAPAYQPPLNQAQPSNQPSGQPNQLSQPKPPTPAAPPPVVAPVPAQQAMVAPAAPSGGPHFIRPVIGQTVQGFGPDGSGQTNDGLNIAAPAGASVKAADSGTVIYTGNELAAFGNLVLIRHAGGWVTAYGHLASIGVTRGTTVTQGQSIGTVGQTGSASTPQLHFEVRQGSKPVDPAPFLNGRG